MSKVFNRTIRPNTLSITFSSTLGNIDRICDEASRFLDRNLKDMEEHLFPINLVIREALTNAVRHGNRLDPEKKVKFFLKIERKKRIRIIVEDQGKDLTGKRPVNHHLWPTTTTEGGLPLWQTILLPAATTERAIVWF